MAAIRSKKAGGVALMFAAIAMMVSAPQATMAATHEVGVLQQVYGFGNWTAVGFGLAGVVVCGVATAGVGVSICGAAAVV